MAVPTYLTINTSKALGARTRQFIDLLEQVQNESAALYNILTTQRYQNEQNQWQYDVVASEFGVTGQTAVPAQDLWNLISGVNTLLQDSDISSALARLGG